MIKLTPNLTWKFESDTIFFWDSDGNCSEVPINQSLSALPDLLESLESGANKEEILQIYDSAFQDTGSILDFLLQNGLVYENGSPVNMVPKDDFSLSFERAFGLTYASEIVCQKNICILGTGNMADAIQSLATPLGANIQYHQNLNDYEFALSNCDLAIVCPDVVNRRMLTKINEFAIVNQINWMPIIPLTRSFISIGPFFRPEEKGPCFSCVNHRLQANWLEEIDQQKAYLVHVEENRQALSFNDLPNYSITFVASIVAAELAKAISGHWSFLLSYEQLVIADLNFCSTAQHPILVVPTCQDCRKRIAPYQKVWQTPMPY